MHAQRDVLEKPLDLFRVCRLRQVVVEAGSGGALTVLGLTPSRQGDNSCAGHFPVLAHFLRHLRAVHIGHADVQEDQVRLVFQGGGEPLRPSNALRT